MAGGGEFYSVERRGHRDGYGMADVDGVVLGDEAGRERKRQKEREKEKDGEGGTDGEGAANKDKEREREKWIWADCPEELLTTIDIDDVWRRWRAALLDIDVRPSEDAGHYLCDFIYYSSLAQLWKENPQGERQVVFLHVPVQSDEASIEKGRTVLIELIRSMVRSRDMKRLVNSRQTQQGSGKAGQKILD